MLTPDLSTPINAIAGEMFKNNREEFNKKAKELTEKLAKDE